MGKHEDNGREFNPVGSNIGEIVEFEYIDPTPTQEWFPFTEEWEAEQKELLRTTGKHRKQRRSNGLVTRLLSWFQSMDLLRPVP